MYPSNPNGENYTNNALQAAFIAFLMSGTPMPPSIPGGTLSWTPKMRQVAKVEPCP